MTQGKNISTKTRNIIIGILILLCVFFIVFAQIQANEAEKHAVTALKYYKEVVEREEDLSQLLSDFETKLDSIQAQLDSCMNQN